MNSYCKKTISIILVFLILLSFVPLFALHRSSSNIEDNTKLNIYKQSDYSTDTDSNDLYNGNEFVLPAGSFTSTNSNSGIEKKLFSNIEYLYWSGETEWLEWEFDVKQDALYQIDITYITENDTGINAVREMYINGKTPYNEFSYLNFPMNWNYSTKEKRFNSAGNEIAPEQKQVALLKQHELTDNEGFHSSAFKIHLNKGENTIRLKYLEQNLSIVNLIIKAPNQPKPYSEVKKSYEKFKNANDIIKIEAEDNILYKNTSTIVKYSDTDPKCSPFSFEKKLINSVGGNSWSNGNQSVVFSLKVEKAGLYIISVRFLNSFTEGLPSFRQIKLDGKVPFKELEAYPFYYSRSWQTTTLGNNVEPYLFYLEQGEHTLSLTSNMGIYSKTIESFNDDAMSLSDLLFRINMITGSNPDANFDYELAKHIKTIKDEINAIAKGSQNKIDFLTKNSKGSSSILGGLKQIKQQLTSFAENPEIIVAKLDELNSIMVNLSNWYKVLQNVGLSIDCFWLSPQDYKVPNIKSNLFDILKLTFINVFLSYFKDYNNVDKISIGKTNNIEVWTSSGIEWADILRRMIDEDFTQKTGTTVKLNILPAGQVSAGSINALMLSVINGKAPDVVLGLDAGSPTEFAMRNVVYDLTQFKDYNDVSKRFTPNIMEAFKYKKGIYALPSTMDFKVMFYRVDILSKYKIKIPETWNELYENVLPILYDNKLSCWVPMDYSMFLFQNGGTFYTKDYLKSALDTPEAYKSFKQMLDLFIRYGVPVSTNFFNRFRTGEIPIGISTMADYMKLQVGAPELAGRWAIAQVPGTLKDDGTIDRSVGSLAGQTSILINQSKNKDKAWEFLKWWTSEAIQTKYGHNLEANLGTAARWNSANIKSFKSQNWRKKDLAVIEECWQWEHEIQGVPGGYYTGRNISNAWNRIIVGNQAMTIRDSLEQAVKDINKEMKLKQKEYNYTKNNSN